MPPPPPHRCRCPVSFRSVQTLQCTAQFFDLRAVMANPSRPHLPVTEGPNGVPHFTNYSHSLFIHYCCCCCCWNSCTYFLNTLQVLRTFHTKKNTSVYTECIWNMLRFHDFSTPEQRKKFIIIHVRSVGIATPTGWTVRGSNPGGGDISRTRLDRPWGPPSLL